jgi:hypothetical protein
MGLFDDLGKALKEVEDAVKKPDSEKQVKDARQGLTRAGKDLPAKTDEARTPAQRVSPVFPASKPAPAARSSSRSPHPGYGKIAGWMKRTYTGRISRAGDSLQKNLELDLLAAEACSMLSEKTRKGFLAYLKKQNYEPLLK